MLFPHADCTVATAAWKKNLIRHFFQCAFLENVFIHLFATTLNEITIIPSLCMFTLTFMATTLGTTAYINKIIILFFWLTKLIMPSISQWVMWVLIMKRLLNHNESVVISPYKSVKKNYINDLKNDFNKNNSEYDIVIVTV